MGDQTSLIQTLNIPVKYYIVVSRFYFNFLFFQVQSHVCSTDAPGNAF